MAVACCPAPAHSPTRPPIQCILDGRPGGGVGWCRFPHKQKTVLRKCFIRNFASSHLQSARRHGTRSEEHTSELQSLMRISYAVFCLKKKKRKTHNTTQSTNHSHKLPL